MLYVQHFKDTYTHVTRTLQYAPKKKRRNPPVVLSFLPCSEKDHHPLEITSRRRVTSVLPRACSPPIPYILAGNPTWRAWAATVSSPGCGWTSAAAAAATKEQLIISLTAFSSSGKRISTPEQPEVIYHLEAFRACHSVAGWYINYELRNVECIALGKELTKYSRTECGVGLKISFSFGIFCPLYLPHCFSLLVLFFN